ncbi:BQ2448_6884 [Microbotryum intermedium]|uniref:BQ2448_6884 protein n=1 Tax=Microbotryum intermedium TaxID=269621 RepID=A0A238FJJ4_9BASI|nr:BQ2448_6884 [Microbotryum intermedium]
MPLRQRKPPTSSSASSPSTSTSSSSDSSKERRVPRGMTMSRPRLALLFAPLILGWIILFQRRSSPTQHLPKFYAVCSYRNTSQVYTFDANDSKRGCVIVRNGKIVDTDNLQHVREVYGDEQMVGKDRGIKVFRLRKGQMLLPGLTDAHAHVLQNGEAASAVDLVGSTSVQDVIERIAAFVEKDDDLRKDRSKFILALGWDQTKWPGGEFPTSDDLEKDPRLAGRPIHLKRIDVHALWVSKAILDRMGSLPEHVTGGLIVRAPDGSATGVFLDNAMALVAAVIPPWTDEDRVRFLTSTARQMLDLGLTSVHDASLSLADITFLRKIDQERRLPIRIYGMVSCEPLNSYCGEKVERYQGDRFEVRAVKIFTDGALGSWGAAMKEDYSDRKGEKGILISPQEEIGPLVKKWIDKGFQVNSHVIGDHAAQIILDAYEQHTPAGVSARDLRLRLEHAQILVRGVMGWFSRRSLIKISASTEPRRYCTNGSPRGHLECATYACDMSYAEQRIGPERIKGAYAWASLKTSGSPIALGSDFPVEKVDPMLGIYAATTRKWINGDSPHGTDGWYPSERLSMLDTLRGFTTGAAYAAFQEDKLGSLEKGKEADFTVLDRDLFELEDFEIPEVKMVATIVGGRLFAGRL